MYFLFNVKPYQMKNTIQIRDFIHLKTRLRGAFKKLYIYFYLLVPMNEIWIIIKHINSFYGLHHYITWKI